MKISTPVYVFIALIVSLFIYLILSFTVFTNTKTISLPGEGTYTGQVKNGYFQGTGTWQSETGVTYKGDFKDGMYDGQGTMTFVNGVVYTGGFKDGFMDGQGVMTFPDGHTHEGEWEANQFKADHECEHDH